MKNILFTLALLISFSSFGQTAKEYFQSGYDKDKNGDYYGAIADYNKAIELNPSKNNLAMCYYNRGLTKNRLKDNYGAISDYTKAIEIDPNYTNAYINRGISKRKLEDYYGAIADYNKVIELDPNAADAYGSRGYAKELLGDMSGACADWKKAASLGHPNAAKWVANQCNTEQVVPPPPPPPDVIESTETDQEEEIDIEDIEVDEYEDVEMPFAVIENVPVFPGCEKGNNETKRQCMSEKIAKFVQRKFNTELAGDLGLSGRQRISVMFKIDKTGNVVEVRARAPHPRLEKEAVRVINLLPKMKPGRQRGQPTTVAYSLPIIFKVQD